MRMTKHRTGRRPRNPLSLPLAVFSTVSLLTTGAAAILSLDSLMAWIAVPILLGASALLVMYTAFAIRLGWIASVGHAGQVYHCERAQQPICYWLLAVIYLTVSGSAFCFTVYSMARHTLSWPC